MLRNQPADLSPEVRGTAKLFSAQCLRFYPLAGAAGFITGQYDLNCFRRRLAGDERLTLFADGLHEILDLSGMSAAIVNLAGLQCGVNAA